MTKKEQEGRELRRVRWSLLLNLDRWLSTPMTFLAFVWIVLTIRELTVGLSPLLSDAVTYIWIIFGLHFILQFFIAPDKKIYLKHNWLTALSLLLPAIRIFRVLRVFRYARFIRGTHVIKILSSINRGMNVLAKKMERRGLLYVMSLTAIIVFAGAAGVMAFEKESSDYFDSYWVAVWWTAMMITTMGTDFFPKSAEARMLSLLLAIYGFAIFGYVTASVATFFIDTVSKRDKDHKKILKIEEELEKIKDRIG